MSKIESIHALEILDSRALPTLRVYVKTISGSIGIASVPSGASTGTHEALELRDGDPLRYFGKGVEKAMSHVEGPLAKVIVGMEVSEQEAIDARMREVDGTPNKSMFGANAMLGISMAVARAAAKEQEKPLYAYLAQLFLPSLPQNWILPIPMLNIINGGAHADNNVDAQEFMIRPIGANSFHEAMRWSCEVYGHLKKILKASKLSTCVGDEGGFAPALQRDEEALALIVEAIQSAGLQPKTQMTIALDPAASEFYEDGFYCDKKKMARGLIVAKRTTLQQVELLQTWVNQYPIDSIEDGLAESDWEGFTNLTSRLKSHCQIVGDDLLVTNPIFVQKAIQQKAVTAVLVKLNQIGTVSETLQTMDLAHRHGLKTIVSHRSGETEDTFIADLAVATQSGQIKTGAPCRSERVAKYNRLLEIENQLGFHACYGKQ